MTDDVSPAWVRQRRMRLSTSPWGVIGAGWVLYSVGVLGAVYGFLFLPPRGWGLLQVTGVLALALAALAGISELVARSSYAKLNEQLDALPFDVTGYPAALADHDLDEARIELDFTEADAGADGAALTSAVAELDAMWLRTDDAGALVITAAAGEGTNWQLHQRVQRVLVDICAAVSEHTALSAARISASSSARTSASDE